MMFYLYFDRSVFSRSCQITQRYVSSGLALFESITVTSAAVDGILPLTVQSVQPQQPLMVECTWHMEPAADIRIYTAYVTLKESVRKSTRAQCVWDSGSANVAVTSLLMLRQAGPECPGCTWKKYLPHRLNNSRFCFPSNFKRD